MLSLFKKQEEEIVAIFDIGNGSIGGALVKFSKHDHPVVLYCHREPLTYAPHPTPKHLLGGMLKLLKSVATHLAKEGLIHVKTTPFGGHTLRDAYCVFASPWYISQTKVVKSETDTPVLVTQETINELVKKEQEAFNAALKEGKYEQLFGPDTHLLEKKVINIRLNGYDTEDPIGKKSKELELTLFSSFISREITKEVEDVLHHAFAVRNIHHSSYALVSWAGSQLMFPDIHDYFFVDVSGETTDISLVVRDVLVETISFPMGRSTLLRKLVKDLNLAPDVALSFLTMKYAGTIEPGFGEKLENTLKPIATDWHDQMVTALTTFQKIYALPRAALMTADSDTAQFFVQALSQPIPVELNIAQNTLAPTFIGPDKVQPFIYEVEGIQHDAFIGIESVFFNDSFK
jgi:hypothetical protein